MTGWVGGCTISGTTGEADWVAAQVDDWFATAGYGWPATSSLLLRLAPTGPLTGDHRVAPGRAPRSPRYFDQIPNGHTFRY
jgi:hypothetical protein